jgi:ABC-type dipeptide/oligopeptide/nickel transport system ATPase component
VHQFQQSDHDSNGGMLMRSFIVLALLTTSALADEPTVTLTRAELQQIINAEGKRAIANQAMQEATGVYQKVKEALDPPKPPASTTEPPK